LQLRMIIIFIAELAKMVPKNKMHFLLYLFSTFENKYYIKSIAIYLIVSAF
jgi:hypothetical protein